MAVDLVHYTITGAQDWPMFKEMLSGIRWLVGIASGCFGSLVGLMWWDLRNRIATQRKEDKDNCARCKKARDGAFLELWDTIDVIAPRNPTVIAAKKRYLDSGGSGC
jgi:hypothetical protein